MTDRIRLGSVLAPSGVVVVIDPGYAALWAHAEQDFDRDEGWPFDEDTLETARTAVDIRITGPDAAEAGRRFNRQWHHLWLYDIPKAETASLEQSFRDVAAAHGLNATLEVSHRRIPHRERVNQVVEQGGGAGEIQVHGVTNAVCAGIPTDRELAVFADFMPEGDNETRWRRIYLEVTPGREIASSEKIGETGVDWARLMFVDADALSAWGTGESLDGLADLICWGRDVEAVAAAVGAERIDDVRYGWRNIPLSEVDALDEALTSESEKQNAQIGTAYWPHSNHWRLMREVWASSHESASIDLGASRLCGFMTSWGDAIFDVLAERDATGALVRLTIDCGSEDITNRQRQLEDKWFGEWSKCAIVTRSVMEEGKPVVYLFREEPVGGTDSGWVVTGGENRAYFDDAQNVVLVRLSELVHRHAELAELLESPEGSAFLRSETGQGFTAVEFPDPLAE